VIVVQFLLAAPFYTRSAKSGLETVDQSLERASLSLGASPLRTFIRVTLPLARNSMLAGLALTWAKCIGEFGATIMFAGNYFGTTQTASLAIFTAMQSLLDPAKALSVVVLTACFVLFVGMRLLTRGSLLYA